MANESLPDIRVAIIMPTHERKVDYEAVLAMDMNRALDPSYGFNCAVGNVVNSGHPSLPHCFNRLLCEVLNHEGQFTHMAMLHSDIVPEDGWLSKLIAIILEKKADVITVATPIKDERGMTGIGIGLPGNHCEALKKFTMHEIFELPETF